MTAAGRIRILLIVVFSLLSAAVASAQGGAGIPQSLSNARVSMRNFIDAEVNGNDADAAQSLDFSGLSQPPDAEKQQDLARKLKAVLDRLWYVNYKVLPDDPDAEVFRIPPGAAEQPIELAKSDDGAWRFSAATVANIDDLYERYKDVAAIAGPPPWYQKIKLGDNALWRIAALFIAILVAFFAARIVRFVLNRSAASFDKRNRELAGAFCRALGKSAGFVLFVIGLRIGIEFLVLNSTVAAIAATCISILMALAVAVIAWNLVSVVDAWLTSFAARTTSTLDDMLIPMVRASLRVTIVVLSLVQIATILSDKPITSVIAGLGVGGLAIGLAAQDMIKNFFGSLMIFSDRPFELGDRVVVDGFDGPVETVGFRSTQIRTLDGHLVTIPNGELANKSICNIGKRPNIKRSFNLGVTYDTTPEKLLRAKEIVAEILTNHEGMNPELPPRVFFNEFGDSALNLSVSYWYHPPDYWAYCEFTERVNTRILERFNAEGIEFAFPSQTLYLAGQATGQ